MKPTGNSAPICEHYKKNHQPEYSCIKKLPTITVNYE